MSKFDTNTMLFNIKGKLNQIRLSPSNSLLPLFEAIVNSIHATKDSGIQNGLIQIELIRDNRQLLIDNKDFDFRPIRNIKIIDNGIGFNEENYTSFQTANSIHKSKIGGKGVGRFVWLKAFKSVEIESIYKEEEQFQRTFKFDEANFGISNHINKKVKNKSRYTTVSLIELRTKFREAFPKELELIVEKVIRHCLDYFVLKNCPTITIKDINNDSEIILNDIYKKCIQKIKSSRIDVKDYSFDLDVYKVLKIKTKHLIHYCANNREVYSKPLSNDIPELNRKIVTDDDNEFYIHAYIKGKYLDEIVNSERTGFNFPIIDENNIEFNEEISEDYLKKYVLAGIENSISVFLKQVRENKLDKIRKYVEKKAPQYRPLFKYRKKQLERLPILSEGKLEIELFKILHSLEVELKKEGRSILQKIKTNEDYEKYEKEYSKYIEKVIDVGNTNLSKYILHRRVVLSLLEKNLRKNKLGKFAKESAIHKLIFPLTQPQMI